ncbi:MAG: hypothetical protein U1A27_12080 [Phycisphaerae bacterium]
MRKRMMRRMAMAALGVVAGAGLIGCGLQAQLSIDPVTGDLVINGVVVPLAEHGRGGGADDPAGHDLNDDHGMDGARHDLNDDAGMDDADHDLNDDNGMDDAGHDVDDDHGVDPVGEDEADDAGQDPAGHDAGDDSRHGGGHGA